MKILLAADGSVFTTKAVEYLSQHLNTFQGKPEVHLLTVKAPLPSGLAASRARSILGNEAVDAYYKEEGAEQLHNAKAVLDAAKIPYQTHVHVGRPSEEICAFADQHKVDLIVAGSHGHSALANMVMGSVATEILAHTKVPVLIIR